MAKRDSCSNGKWLNPKTNKCEPKTILLEKTKTGDPRDWRWVYIDKNKVVKGEGHSPYSGHELERQLSSYTVKDRGKTIRNLLKKGYDIIGSSKKVEEVEKIYG